MIETNYEKLMQDKGVKLEELPKNAQTGIKSIKQWMMMVNLQKKTGKVTKQEVWDKIEMVDDLVCKEITNFSEGKAPLGTPIPKGPTPEEIEAAKLADKAKLDSEAEATRLEAEKLKTGDGKTNDTPPEDKRGEEVDKELKVLLTAGKASLTLQDIKDTAPNAYAIIFEAYEPDGTNGIETTHYRLVETSKEVFALSKI